MFLIFFINLVLGYDYESLKAQVDFSHLPDEYTCFFNKYSYRIIDTLASCDSQNYENINNCVISIGKTINAFLVAIKNFNHDFDCRPLVLKENCTLSFNSIGNLEKILQNESECIIFNALKSYLQTKGYEKSLPSFEKLGLNLESLENLREDIIKDTETDSLCSKPSNKIGDLIYRSIKASASDIIMPKIVLHASKHFYEDEEDLYQKIVKLIDYIEQIYRSQELFSCIILTISERISKTKVIPFLGEQYTKYLKEIIIEYMPKNIKKFKDNYCENHPTVVIVDKMISSLLRYRKMISFYYLGKSFLYVIRRLNSFTSAINLLFKFLRKFPILSLRKMFCVTYLDCGWLIAEILTNYFFDDFMDYFNLGSVAYIINTVKTSVDIFGYF